MKAVIFDFAESRAGRHAEQFLDRWRGTLVCDDYSGYKALIRSGVTEAGCMAHYPERSFILRPVRSIACSRRVWSASHST